MALHESLFGLRYFHQRGVEAQATHALCVVASMKGREKLLPIDGLRCKMVARKLVEAQHEENSLAFLA